MSVEWLTRLSDVPVGAVVGAVVTGAVTVGRAMLWLIAVPVDAVAGAVVLIVTVVVAVMMLWLMWAA